MEQLNRIELRGTVGRTYTMTVEGKKMVNFSLATNSSYHDRQGCPVIETTWHQIIAWEGPGKECIQSITKGSQVYVNGRLRCRRFNGADGIDRTAYEVLAHEVRICE